MSNIQRKNPQALIINKKMVVKIVTFLWGIIIIFLALADIFINYFEWVESSAIQRLFNITRDDGLPNWFSSIQLLSISIVLWSVFLFLTYSKPTIIKKRMQRWGWSIIALFFAYLAIDDGSQMHERVGTAFRNSMEARHEYNPGFISKLFDVFPSYGWQFVFVPIFGAVAVFILFFLYKNLTSKVQFIYILIAFGCYVVSVGLDFVEGLDETVYDPLLVFFNTELYTIEHFSKLIEEVFEMVGNTFFMFAFTKHLLNLAEKWKIQFV